MLRSRFLRFFAISLSATLAFLVCHFNPALSLDKEKVAANNPVLVADSGFRPGDNSFRFQNYGGDLKGIQNLTPPDLQRMFGNQVCATKDGSCILTPPAEQWMEEINKAMNGGHCEGMAVLSLLLYGDSDKVKSFGHAPDLVLEGNEKLQREIAYWFATQAVAPTADNEIKDKTPSEILDVLIANLKPNTAIAQTYTMGIYKSGFRGGHAITPYAVEDLGNGKYAVLVYDNNYPKVERRLEIDRNTNHWEYNGSTNPQEAESEYIGDAETKTLTLTPTGPRYGQQECHFCGVADESESVSLTKSVMAQGAKPDQFNQIFLEGEADLLITNGNQKIGYENDRFINSFPGATFIPRKSFESWKDDEEPLYNIPLGVPFTMTLQSGSSKANELTDVVMLGPGYDLGIQGIKVFPGQKDSIKFDASGRHLSYQPSNAETPDILFGISTQNDDYGFELFDVEVDAGATISADLDHKKGRLGIKLSESKRPAIFNLIIARINDRTEQKFEGENLTLNSGDTLYLNYAKWTGNGAQLTIELDEKSDGTIDSTMTINDKKK